ncbi:MAG: pentapeptide repeat-containing protein [Cyanobacteria bacterium J06641_5]
MSAPPDPLSVSETVESTPIPPPTSLPVPIDELPPPARRFDLSTLQMLGAWALLVVGWTLGNTWLGFSGAVLALVLSLPTVLPSVRRWLSLLAVDRRVVVGWLGFAVAILGLLRFLGAYSALSKWLASVQWDEFGSWADWVGAIGQIAIAIFAVYVAWRQYIISRDLTLQQNRITQQQTIDAYFQGVSELALNDEGLLEDWPQERAFAEGRTAAILSGVDAGGKAKIVRFLSQSKLLTPLKRDGHLGRPILDGQGGYAEDRAQGLRVIDLGVMLAGADLAGTDLRWTDLSEANLIQANLNQAGLYKANLSRAILYKAQLQGANLKGTRLFYGDATTATPRVRGNHADLQTGERTGAVLENADFSNVRGLSDEQRYYCCAWCGERSRGTIPGGCDGIPNKLGR